MMAEKGSKGSILLEILIVLMALLLLAVILVPNKLWKEEDEITRISRNNIEAIYEAETFYYKNKGEYTDSLDKLLTFVQSDSGLKQRQSIVSLTRSLIQVINNVLEVPSVNKILKISSASYEITGDMMGNQRHFRNYENILVTSQEIYKEMFKLDSSTTFPNFSHTKLYIDSLRGLRETVSDYPLQIAILRAISYIDSMNSSHQKMEIPEVLKFWEAEYLKTSKFISDIQKTDIVKFSSVPDRLKKFIDQINTNLSSLSKINLSQDANQIKSDEQNLIELHKKFVSPDFFILTERYGMHALDETDSILINLTHENFYCPDSREIYIIDTTNGKLTVESPNLLIFFQEKFQKCVKPIEASPLYDDITLLDSVFHKTIIRLNENKNLLRRNTDLLLSLKELIIIMEDRTSSSSYRYLKEVNKFVLLIQKEKKLSVLKPTIEDILNPIDTLASRIERKNLTDLEKLLTDYKNELIKVDSVIAGSKISARIRKNIQPNIEPFQEAFAIFSQIESNLDPSFAKNLKRAGSCLEKTMLNALEGKTERMYVIFGKKHINHGYIKQGEKSWEEEE
jgi:competence protein ComGC